MTDHYYTTPLAHLILSSSSGWAMKSIASYNHPIVFSAFAFLLGHGILGILRYTHPSANSWSTFRMFFDFTSLIATSLPLSLVNAELHFDYKQRSEFACMYVIASILPIISKYALANYSTKMLDVVMLSNISSLAFIGITNENYWATGLSALCLMNHFLLIPIADRFSVPKVDLFTIGLTFFNIFAVRCLTVT